MRAPWLAVALCLVLILVVLNHQSDTMRIVEKVVEKWLDHGGSIAPVLPDLQ